MIEGFATSEGTRRFAERFPALREAHHFRAPKNVKGPEELLFSSLGLGTYLGEPDEASDQLYVQAIEAALRSGINVLDTAINYRHQRSERNIGEAVQQLVQSGDMNRDEVIVCTKAGYLSLDGSVPADPKAYFTREYVETGVLKQEEVAGRMHCMAPKYLENQLERSRKNLGLETIDVFYLHNPESQLGGVPREEFRNRIKSAFQTDTRKSGEGGQDLLVWHCVLERISRSGRRVPVYVPRAVHGNSSQRRRRASSLPLCATSLQPGDA
jgi:hypothetical protein